MRVEFKEGWREVPDHLGKLLQGLETWTMSYQEAVEKANWKLAADYANKAQDDIIRAALRGD
jgi:hypothetical protein